MKAGGGRSDGGGRRSSGRQRRNFECYMLPEVQLDFADLDRIRTTGVSCCIDRERARNDGGLRFGGLVNL